MIYHSRPISNQNLKTVVPSPNLNLENKMAHQEISSFEFEPSLKIQIHARYRPAYLTFAFQLCNILTLSLLYRFCTWFPSLEKHLFTLFCKDFQEATHVFVQSSLGPTELIKLKRIEDFVIFDYHGSRFLLQKSLFVSLNSLPRTSTPHASSFVWTQQDHFCSSFLSLHSL